MRFKRLGLAGIALGALLILVNPVPAQAGWGVIVGAAPAYSYPVAPYACDPYDQYCTAPNPYAYSQPYVGVYGGSYGYYSRPYYSGYSGYYGDRGYYRREDRDWDRERHERREHENWGGREGYGRGYYGGERGYRGGERGEHGHDRR